MMLKELALKYIQNTDRVFAKINLSQDAVYIDRDKTREIINAAKRYLEDAKYYCEKKQFETSLISVSYCEGLLDALRILGLADFQW